MAFHLQAGTSRPATCGNVVVTISIDEHATPASPGICCALRLVVERHAEAQQATLAERQSGVEKDVFLPGNTLPILAPNTIASVSA